MLPTLTTPSGKGALRRALERFAERETQRRRVTRIGFLIDATASRAPTWEQAQAAQAQMFRSVQKLGRLAVRLVHFGGGRLTDDGWFGDPQKAAAAVARVRCQSGVTRILPGLAAFLDAPPEMRPSAIILIGDSFEEDAREAERVGAALRNAGIRVFSFLEGDDGTAGAVFGGLARLTGGRFAALGAELPLHALCEAVALLAAGGAKALARLPDGPAKRLLLAGPSTKEKAR
ncbi:VWA domain-containing protein [Sinorhizobium meliloti]|uniref:VWA domain-containing protein n=1 Tax=Rhizobium meliloti TaxID=382 RepID=UPI00299D27E1|nr:VWA domain-containing protein [Sinorhizobium meliloti]